MPAFPPSPAWICCRCRSRFSNVAGYALPKSIRTITSTPSYPRYNESKSRRPQKQVWRTLLGTKSLGQESSVLVLRDFESNFGSEELEEPGGRVEDEQKNVTTKDILSSLDSKKSEPNWVEVMKEIDALRPVSAYVAPGDVQILSKAQVEKMVKQLSDRFSRSQLTSYIATKRRESPTVSDPPRRQERSKPSIVSRSEWKPIGHSQENKIGAGGAKGGILRRLVKSIWKIAIEEELYRKGFITLRLEAPHLQLLLSGGNKSILSELSTSNNAKIDVLQSKNLLKVTTDRMVSAAVADSIEDLCNGTKTAEFDASQFLSGSYDIRLDPLTLQQIAEKCRCVVEFQPDKAIFSITSFTEEEVNRCQRMLFMSTKKHDSVGTTILDGDVNDLGLFIKAEAVLNENVMPGIHPPSLQRFHFAQSLRSDTPSITEDLPNRTFRRDTIEQLKARINGGLHERGFGASTEPMANKAHDVSVEQNLRGSYWEEASNWHLQAEFGQVLHRINPGPNSYDNVDEDLKTQNSPDSFFVPSPSSIARYLRSNHRNIPSETEDTFRVKLVPTKLMGTIPDEAGEDVVTPELELLLKFDKRYGTLSPKSLAAKLSTRRTSVLTPDLTFDVRFTKIQTRQFLNPELDETLANFVKQLHVSSTGNFHITPTSHLNMKLPSSLVHPVSERANLVVKNLQKMEWVDVNYFVAGSQYEECLIFDSSGLDLVYTCREAHELGYSQELLSLQTTSDYSTAHQPEQSFDLDQSAGSKQSTTALHTHDTDGFIFQVEKIMAQLNRGLVNTQYSGSNIR